MTAGLAAAGAAKSTGRPSCFVAGIDFDLPIEVVVASSSSSLVCLPISNVQENVVVQDIFPIVASSLSVPKSGNISNFHFD